MKLSTFLTIAAVLAVLYGLGFLLIPAQTLSLYGVTLDTSGLFIARYMGSAFLGIAIVAWFVRDAPQQVLKPVILGNFVLSVTGLIVAVWDAFAGGANSLVWATVIIYLFLTLGFGYFQFMAKPSPKLATR